MKQCSSNIKVKGRSKLSTCQTCWFLRITIICPFKWYPTMWAFFPLLIYTSLVCLCFCTTLCLYLNPNRKYKCYVLILTGRWIRESHLAKYQHKRWDLINIVPFHLQQHDHHCLTWCTFYPSDQKFYEINDNLSKKKYNVQNSFLSSFIIQPQL